MVEAISDRDDKRDCGPVPLIIGRDLSKGFENDGLRIEVIKDTSFEIACG